MVYVALLLLVWQCRSANTSDLHCGVQVDGFTYDLSMLEKSHSFYEVRDLATDSTFFALSYSNAFVS